MTRAAPPPHYGSWYGLRTKYDIARPGNGTTTISVYTPYVNLHFDGPGGRTGSTRQHRQPNIPDTVNDCRCVFNFNLTFCIYRRHTIDENALSNYEVLSAEAQNDSNISTKAHSPGEAKHCTADARADNNRDHHN